MPKKPEVLEHISDAMRAFYTRIERRYRLSEHHRRLLMVACQAHSRMEQAQATVAREGLTTVDRHGLARPHPAIQIEIQCRTGFIRALRELALADEDLPSDVRPPRLRGRYAGRA